MTLAPFLGTKSPERKIDADEHLKRSQRRLGLYSGLTNRSWRWWPFKLWV